VSARFDGTDHSWLAVDADGSIGWFTVNGSGPVPETVRSQPDELLGHEERLARWVRASGRAFEFGAGDSMWRDAAAIGIYPFDFDDVSQRYTLVARPRDAVRITDAPVEIRSALVVSLPCRFTTGCVLPATVADARHR
jgi:hypothetical protein